VVNGHKCTVHTDSPDGDTGKTCLGGGMHCPRASSYYYYYYYCCCYYYVLVVLTGCEKP